MQSQPDIGDHISTETLENVLTYRCSPDGASLLVALVSSAEIHLVLLTQPNNKILRSDGFTKEFFLWLSGYFWAMA